LARSDGGEASPKATKQKVSPFAAATVGLENDTSATKLPRLNTAMQLFTQSRRGKSITRAE